MHSGETGRTSTPTAQPGSTNPQTQVSDWKGTAEQGLGVASRFAETLLKTLPDCLDRVFSITKAIIEIKDVGHRHHLCISGTADYYMG